MSSSVLSNYLMGGLSIKLFKGVQVFDNTIYGGPALRLDATAPNTFSDFTFDRNRYIGKHLTHPFAFTGVATFPSADCGMYWFNRTSPGFGYGSCALQDNSWQDRLGWDRNGSFTNSVRTGLKTFLLVNEHDPSLATLVVYNWDKLSTVQVEAAPFLQTGDQYEIRSVLNYSSDLASGSYTSAGLSLSMVNRTVAKPIGYSSELGPNTFPEFGEFQMRRTQTNNPAPAAPGNFRLLD